MGHTGPLFTVAHKTKYASIQRSLSQAKTKKLIMREHIPKKILRQKWSINFFSKFQFFREFLQLDGTKNEAEALANNRCI